MRAVLIVSLFLAGCAAPAVEPAGVPPAPITLAPVDEEAAAAPAADQTASFDGPSVDLGFTESGSFAPQQTWAATWPLGADTQVFDLSDRVPMDRPALVHISLKWEADAPVGEGQAWIEGPVVFEERESPTAAAYGVLRAGADAVELHVRYDYPDSVQMPFTVDVRVQAPNDRVLAGFPVAIGLDSATAVLAPKNDTATVHVWGPDDRFLGSVEVAEASSLTLDPFAAGEHVIFVTGGEVAVSGPPSLRSLGFRTTLGTWQDLPAQGPASWEFDILTRPLQVGFALDGVAAARSGDRPYHVTAPDGSVVAVYDGIALQSDELVFSRFVASSVTEGTYVLSAAPDAHRDARITWATRTFDRNTTAAPP